MQSFQFITINAYENDMSCHMAGDWHIDGKDHYGGHISKFWIPFRKTNPDHSNLEFRSGVMKSMPGDVIFFQGTTEHRSQNFYVSRVALMISLSNTPS